MKKITFFAAVIFSCFVTAQDFPASKPHLLVDKEVKVVHIEGVEKDGYYNFYSDHDLTKTYLSPDKPYVPYSLILGKTFKVIKAEDFHTELNHPGTKLQLTDEDGNTLYYRYFLTDEMLYPFEVVGGFDPPKELYCDYIDVTVHPDETTIYQMKEAQNAIEVHKKLEIDEEPYYTMKITVLGHEDIYTPVGVTVAFHNGDAIKMPKEQVIKEFHNGNEFKYVADIRLTEDQMKLLTKHKIVEVHLDKFNKKIYTGGRIKGAVACLMDK